MADLFFRKMTIEDVDVVYHIEQQAHYHPWSKNIIKDAVSSYQCWLLFNQQQLAGYGFLKIIVDEAELLNIAINPPQQNKGLGKLLLDHLMKETEQLGAKECFLEVRESNLNAYHLYESYGFNEIGRRTNYYPTAKGHEDALIMAYLIATD
ncbi:ribosomal protein S18-alanine N-acetyltransferase [Entomomonas asaccharolytica]|uniref:[Ribosomal protein bS18]-alanine N-acetyltransferase n=1 Tax=Entomomonas asaccharolytica TaxID=2785331 RepID=A0A974RYA2_9GAMM|nr:ribosomal protein S18-alanine N-acetyltransferase [Entomomonas asaccharolytica]QQP87096.1 ribosomal protein S18-alanine N-acetyltransferase [Entomomonas asaccharolytica]